MCQTQTLMATLLELPLAQIPPTQVPLLLLPRPQAHSVQADHLGQQPQIHMERQLVILWTRPTPVPADPVLHPPTPI